METNQDKLTRVVTKIAAKNNTIKRLRSITNVMTQALKFEEEERIKEITDDQDICDMLTEMYPVFQCRTIADVRENAEQVQILMKSNVCLEMLQMFIKNYEPEYREKLEDAFCRMRFQIGEMWEVQRKDEKQPKRKRTRQK